MKKSQKINSPKGEVLLIGLDKNHLVIIEERISVFDYYDSLHPILDQDCNFRRERGIRYVIGKIYNYEGFLNQGFLNTYGENGAFIKSQLRLPNGTLSDY